MLRAYWLSKKRDGALPHRRDIDPGEIRGLLPELALVEWLPEADGFRFRLAGTSIERRLGRPLTGRTFGQGENNGRYSEFVEVLQQAARQLDCVETCIANFGDSTIYEAIETTVLPLLRDGDRPTMFLIAMKFAISADSGENRSMRSAEL